jgi:glc operon protein GlcG
MTLTLLVNSRAEIVEKKSLDLEGARKAIAAAIDYAHKIKAPGGVIAVVDEGGNLMALERLDGTFAMGATISVGKARTAVLFKKPTRFFEELINKGRTAMTAVEGFTPLIGGVPIIVDGQVVGGLGVSGAASAAQDEELAMAGVAAISSVTIQKTSSGMAPNATYMPVSPDKATVVTQNEVSAAFANDATLVETPSYKVNASRRDGPRQAEIHARATDVIYVVGGSATFVTGGKAVEPKEIAPDEIRGRSIEGGEAHRISKGDVVIVPAGLPHWFKKVQGPFLYFVCKPIASADGHLTAR